MRASQLAWLAVAGIVQLSSLTIVQAQQKVADDYLVTSLPDLSAEESAQIKQYAGHMALDPEQESNLFFWLVTSRRPQKNQKLVIWLNGGPGCSSADGYFLETGPLRWVDKKLTINKGGWHEFADVVFLDQPVGTGLSYTKQPYLGTMKEITTHFMAFLKAFFTVFPDRAQYDLYLAGESFAGTYIPYFGQGILEYNENVPAGERFYNLQGLAIGNGWIDPLHQYTSYIPFIEKYGLSTPALMESMNAQQEACLDAIRRQDLITQNICEELVSIILRSNSETSQCVNQYDIRLLDRYPECGLNWPYELPLMSVYLNRPEVKAALHATAGDTHWSECSRRVSIALQQDDSTPSIALLPGILEKIRIMLFSGQQDLICNHIGTEYLISNMTWQGSQGFQDIRSIGWKVEDKPAGEWKQAKNLTYVLIYNSSHMVPYDVPLVALDMMNRFMGLDTKLQTFTSSLESDADNAVPSGGEKIDISQPKSSVSANGSAALLFVVMVIGVVIFVIVRKNQHQKKLNDGHNGVQWFPLSNNNGNNQSIGRDHRHAPIDELDELVVEGGIHDSDDDGEYEDFLSSGDRRRSPSPQRR
ncbi:Cell death protease [Linnemannia schmuckeri]|uniref:Pheromone-processing carboxypeptidase KEX1 n=1 Tax=Linnemannia schmuckeri TaxID=64567 RepID=A0A9P5VB74_9FUNG|nr:Cell death protease [Linnemannia schmuckeri]